jgi:molybdate transport system regulatory protein
MKARSDPPLGSWRGRLRLWIDVSGRGTLGPGKLRLLATIGATKSLSAAARKLHMSYRLAWKHLQLIQERTGITVVEPHRGGPRGGGTELTPEGKALLAAYDSFHREVEDHVQSAFARHFARWSSPRSGKS